MKSITELSTKWPSPPWSQVLDVSVSPKIHLLLECLIGHHCYNHSPLGWQKWRSGIGIASPFSILAKVQSPRPFAKYDP